MLVHSHFPDSTHINFLHWPLQVLQNGILRGILQQLEKFCPVFQFYEQKFNLKWLFSSSAQTMTMTSRNWLGNLLSPEPYFSAISPSLPRYFLIHFIVDFLLWFNWLTVPSLYFPIPLTISSPIKYPSTVSYYVQLQVISQSPGTLHPDQNSLLQLCAEAHCQPVCPCARPVIGWPGICDEGSASPEDVCCPSCKTQGGKGNYGLVLQHLDKKEVSMLSELWNTNRIYSTV